ncbi:MAG: DUF2971 domain-containing protein [Candidatus Lokiarchaeota archaeon]|nr:DUF2971 domain-containing protein [Candidatus Lokiarchaeota archaeon]
MILYKYCNYKYCTAIFNNKRIKVSRPKELNDIYELIPYPYINTKLLDKEIKKGIFTDLIKENIKINNNIIFKNNKEYINYYNSNKNEILENVNNTIIRTIFDGIKEMQNQTAILSLSKDPLNHLMWSHYASGFKGICIGFEYNKTDYNVKKVKYSNKRPELIINEIMDKDKLADFIIELYTTKSTCWKYEKEYRYIYDIKTNNDKIVFNDIDIDKIKEIYISLKTDIKVQKRLKTILNKKKCKNIKLYKIDYINSVNKYNFIKKEINFIDIGI